MMMTNTERAFERMIKLFSEEAERGEASGEYALGVCYENGFGVPKDPEKAKEYYRKAEEHSNTITKSRIESDAGGDKRTTDDQKAIDLLEGYAENGNADAQYALGICYGSMSGTTDNIARSVSWYTKAAEQGHAGAQCYLGYCYMNGDGAPKDLGKAYIWYTKAAEQGHPGGQYGLGLCYANGDGVTQDYKKAKKWLTKAAKQGDEFAEMNLALLKQHGFI